ncbi:MAG: hypothetical protein IJK14_00900 [Clostridia bacterium]|nr:hypothetical protein [Clostridia bacterium]
MRKWMIFTAAALLIVVAGCGAKKVQQDAAVAVTAVPEPEITEDVQQKTDYSVFAGDYEDEYSQRAMMEAEAGESGLHIVVSWSDSAFAYYRWEMKAVLEGDRLVYSDCINEYFASDDSPEGPSHDILYTNGTGYFEVDSGKLKWTGAQDDSCRECVFSK